MDYNKNKNKSLLTISIILVSLLISIIIIINFFNSSNEYKITGGLIFCLALLIIVVFSGSFDVLSIPKILELRRYNQEKDRQNKELQKNYNELIRSVININNKNVIAINTEKIHSSHDIDDLSESSSGIEMSKEKKGISKEADKYRLNLKKFIIEKQSVNTPNIGYNSCYNNIRITKKFFNEFTCFDAVLFKNDCTTFYDVLVNSISNYNYVLLFKLESLESFAIDYNTRTKLILFIPELDKELDKILNFNSKFKKQYNEINNKFYPSISLGLLELKRINVTKTQIDEYIKKPKKEIDNKNNIEYGE